MKETPKSTNTFDGSLNSDTDKYLIDEKDYIDAFNIRNTINDANKFGLATNALGNTLIPFTQPSGNNTVLGSYENLSTGECYYIVYNSNGESQIRKIEDGVPVSLAQLNWLERKNIPFINLVDNKLFYWTDSTSRKINVEKSRADKIHEGNIYFASANTPDFIPVGTTISITAFDINGAVIGQYDNTALIPFSKENYTAFISASINANLAPNTLGSVIECEKCQDYIEVSGRAEGYFILVIQMSNNVDGIYIPQNYYESIFEALCEAGRRPPNCNPTTSLEFNEDIAVNNLTETAWQFRYSIIYSDYQESVLSPASDLVYIKCETNKNFIRIDLTDEKLTDTNWLSDIRAIRVVGRPANNSKYRQVAYIEQKDLWNFSGDFNTITFDFYNDGQYAVIDDTYSETQYYNTPISPIDDNYSIAQETFDDRIGYTRYNQDYDKPCVEATLTPSFTPFEPEDYSITLIVRIYNQQQFWATPPIYEFPFAYGDGRIGAIYSIADQDYPVWGAACDRNVNGEAAVAMGQFLPEGGFVGYLAGTPYYAISKQQRPISDVSLVFLPDNIIDATSPTNLALLEASYENYNNTNGAQGDLFSVLTIKGIKEGKYVFRLASHWCSFDDKLGKGGMYDLYSGTRWQTTSTNTRAFTVVDQNGALVSEFDGTELILEFANDTVTVSNYNGVLTSWTSADRSYYLGDVLVEDLSVPNYLTNANLVAGMNWSSYVVDAGVSTHPGILPTLTNPFALIQTNLSDPEVLEAIKLAARCELAQVLAEMGVIDAYKFFQRTTVATRTLALPTDHNGYIYYKGVETLTTTRILELRYGSTNGRANPLNKFFTTQDSATAINTSILKSLYETGDYIERSAFSNISAGGNHTQGYIFTTNDLFSTECCTVVTGQVVDADGNGVGCVNVVISRNGRQETTQADGTFSILVYEDGQRPPTFGNNERIFDQIIFNACSDCVVTFDNTGRIYDSYGLSITPIGAAGFNFNNQYAPAFLNDVTCERVLEFFRKLKAGGTYNFAILHVDTQNRRSDISTLEVAIPFLTEDVNSYFPSLPSQTAFGAFSFSLNITSTPPDWADKAYVLRTQDQFYLDYLQFALFDAKYVISYNDETQVMIKTSYATFSANQIYLGLPEAFRAYRSQNAGSNKSWTFEEGDRVRFIKNQNNSFYSDNFDFEIQGVRIDSDTGYQYYVIDNLDALGEVTAGTVVEVYRPRKKVDYNEKLYFEIHQCIDIVNGAYVGLPLTLDTGDTYPRARNMVTEDGSIVSYIEDNSISDFWVSRDEDIGRPNAERPTLGRIQQTNAVVYSGKYQQSSLANRLNAIELNNIAYFPINYGFISSMKLSNEERDTQVLLLICEHKVISIYVGVVQFRDVTGSDIVATSSEVLGSFRTMTGTYGTINPESVHRKNSIVYFYDLYRKKWVKYDNNGLDAISDRKIKTLAESITPTTVISGFEDYYEQYQTTAFTDLGLMTLSGGAVQYFLSKQTGLFPFTQSSTQSVGQLVVLEISGRRVFGEITNNNPLTVQSYESTSFMPNSSEGVTYRVLSYLTLAYFDPSNKWETKFSYAPEMYGSGGESYYAFHNGNAYLMSSNQTRNNWFGIQYKSSITAIAKIAPKAIKMFMNLKQTANRYWKTFFTTNPIVSQAPFGMTTTAEESEARLLEGSWWNKILRDENDPVYAGNILQARYRGRELRGNYVEGRVETESTEQTEIRSIDVFQIPSENTAE